MADGTEPGGRRGTYVVAAATAVLLVVGVALVGSGLRSTAGPPQPDGAAAVPPSPSAPSTQRPLKRHPSQRTAPSPAVKTAEFGPILASSDPVALDIPSIGVHSTNIVDLGLASDGTIEVPADASAPGWFTPGPSPGQLGPSVIAGHVDSLEGPAVFYRLGELAAGDRVRVTLADAAVGTFVIDRVEQFEKATFPTHQVYGDTTGRAELRLITCGGTYDEDKGYLGNVVAFGHLAAAS